MQADNLLEIIKEPLITTSSAQSKPNSQDKTFGFDYKKKLSGDTNASRRYRVVCSTSSIVCPEFVFNCCEIFIVRREKMQKSLN